MDLIPELEAELARLGSFAWEIGPGTTAPNMFAISPSGDLARLEQTRHIVELAPAITGWELLPARPARPGTTLVIDDLAIDYAAWRCLALRHPDGAVEVILSPDRAIDVDDETRWRIGEIIVDAAIGEAERLRYIDDVVVEPELEPSLVAALKPLAELGRIVTALRRPHEKMN